MDRKATAYFWTKDQYDHVYEYVESPNLTEVFASAKVFSERDNFDFLTCSAGDFAEIDAFPPKDFKCPDEGRCWDFIIEKYLTLEVETFGLYFYVLDDHIYISKEADPDGPERAKLSLEVVADLKAETVRLQKTIDFLSKLTGDAA